MKPTEIIAEWFNEMHQDLQMEIAFQFLVVVPDLPIKKELFSDEKAEISKMERLPEIFIAWLRQHAWISAEVGARAWVAKSLIEFIVFDKKKTEQDFEDRESRQDNFIKFLSAKEEHNLVESAKEIYERDSSRQILWLIAYSNWRSLCENDLSDEQIRLWVDRNLAVDRDKWE